jgi:hypothetical protein
VIDIPIIAPFIERKEETGIFRYVAIASHIVAAIIAIMNPHIRSGAVGRSFKISDCKISTVGFPIIVAPNTSIKNAKAADCDNVNAPEPTDVPNDAGTSFVPAMNARAKVKNPPTIGIHL